MAGDAPCDAHAARPEIRTSRLHLRPLVPDDASRIALLAADREIAANTSTIPHPYTLDDAEKWIEEQAAEFADGRGYTFAIDLIDPQPLLVGAVGLTLDVQHDSAELGYWIGVPYWGQGYASESAAAALDFGIEVAGIRRITARHFARNLWLRAGFSRRSGCGTKARIGRRSRSGASISMSSTTDFSRRTPGDRGK